MCFIHKFFRRYRETRRGTKKEEKLMKKKKLELEGENKYFHSICEKEERMK